MRCSRGVHAVFTRCSCGVHAVLVLLPGCCLLEPGLLNGEGKEGFESAFAFVGRAAGSSDGSLEEMTVEFVKGISEVALEKSHWAIRASDGSDRDGGYGRARGLRPMTLERRRIIIIPNLF
jgi:hypothetical protein